MYKTLFHDELFTIIGEKLDKLYKMKINMAAIYCR